MSEQTKYFCDKKGCGVEIENGENSSVLVADVGAMESKEKSWSFFSHITLHLCPDHIKEFKDNYNLK